MDTLEQARKHLETLARSYNLEGEIIVEKPPGGVVGPAVFNYEEDGELQELGWSVELAEEALKAMANDKG